MFENHLEANKDNPVADLVSEGYTTDSNAPDDSNQSGQSVSSKVPKIDSNSSPASDSSSSSSSSSSSRRSSSSLHIDYGHYPEVNERNIKYARCLIRLVHLLAGSLQS